MKKKVMLLMMLIPLIFMLTIYSVSKVASIVVDIPVSGIIVTTENEDGYIDIDMATYTDDLYLKAEVFPYNAKNKKYSIDISEVGNEPTANITIDNNGLVHVYGIGQAKITVTSNEHGFTDSVIISVTSSKVLDFIPTVNDAIFNSIELLPSDSSEYDYIATVLSGELNFSATICPNNLTNYPVTWTSNNENVMSISAVTGKANANLSGNTIITATTENGINGAISKKIKLNVVARETYSGLTVNGCEDGEILCPKNSNKVIFFAEVTNGDSLIIKSDEVITDKNIENLGVGKYKVTLTLADNHAKNVNLHISAGNDKTNVVTAVFDEFLIGIYTGYHTSGDEQIYIKESINTLFFADIIPYDKDVTYVWTLSNNNSIEIIDTKNSVAQIQPLCIGDTLLTVTAYKNGETIGTVKKNVTVVRNVTSLIFGENAKTYGIGGVLALGDTDILRGNYIASKPSLDLKIQNADKSYSSYEWEKFGSIIELKSSDENVAVPSPSLSQFKIKINNTGNVIFTAKWIYSDYFKENTSTSVFVKIVKDGVNVDSYDDLKKATSDGKKIVVTNNIMLGKKDPTDTELLSYANYMPTTYDWQYYENKGDGRPNVMYLIEFKNDVYGNGYEINGDYITTATDNTGNPLLFKGPLDFVSVPSVASVKGQDNIVFLVRNPHITLDNIILKGCSDQSLCNDVENLDLSKLNFVGTTVEIAADCIVKNCRISNGRTVMRIFGGGETNGKPVVSDSSLIDAEKERIKVTVDSCVLTNAREFIIKTGSNRAIMATGNTAETFKLFQFTDKNGNEYLPNNDEVIGNNYFYENYVTTDLTIKDSILYTSGLFSIGVETHFAGEMLAGIGLKLNDWDKLAATSYATAVNLVGDVRFFDWKKLENVDSSTLIETYGTLSDNKLFLKMDIASMINKVSTTDGYNNIISVYENNRYVHGGIAFYGGGYNYSYLNCANMTNEAFTEYLINLNILKNGESSDSALYMQGSMLPMAAGKSSFRFYMYDGNSATNYDKQISAIDSGEAFKLSSAN